MVLREAERLAVDTDLRIGREQQVIAARQQTSTSARALPDPQLRLTALNFPVDDFSADREPLTQGVAALRQALPRGRSLHYRGLRADAAVAEAQQALAVEKRSVLQQVRELWVTVHVRLRQLELLEERRGLYGQLIPAMTAEYRAGRAAQGRVVDLRLQRARIEDRKARLAGEQRAARERLAKWLGPHAQRPWPQSLPHWLEQVPTGDLGEHPELERLSAQAIQARAEVSLARQAYLPAINLEFAYGIRSARTDVVSIGVVLDLPIFPDKRQDRRLAETERSYMASRYALADRRAELQARVRARRAEADAQHHRLAIYRGQILPELARTTELVKGEYQAGRAGLADVLQSRLVEVEAREQYVERQLALARSVIRLAYLLEEDKQR